jgi:hypothetical protein
MLDNPNRLPYEDPEQYNLAYNNMTVARLCGLLQSDGNFGIIYEKDKTLKPRIILSHTCVEICFLRGIKDWLFDRGIRCNLPLNSTDRSHAVNLTIERTNCRRLILLIELEEANTRTPLLFDRKRKDYLLMREAIDIKDNVDRSEGLTRREAALLTDIQMAGIRADRIGPKGLTRGGLMARFGFPTFNSEGAATTRIEAITKRVIESGDEVKNILLNTRQINPALAEFVAGLYDGDGSFRVGFEPNITIDGKKKSERLRTFTFSPQLILTNQKETDPVLYSILNIIFGCPSSPRVELKEKTGQGVVYRIKSVRILKEFVIPFFNEHQSCLRKNLVRFEILTKVTQSLPEVYKSQLDSEKLITEIYQKDIYPRVRTLKECLEIIALNYY